MRRTILVACAVAALAAGGYAYAATTGGGGAVNACAKSANGQLRLDTGGGCLPTETAVQLGGASHVDEWGQYYGIDGGPTIVNGVWPDVHGHETVIQRFHLGKGQYLVSAEILLQNESGVGVIVCQIESSTSFYALAQAAVGTPAGFAQQQTVQEQTVVDATTPLDLELVCFNAPPNEPAGNPVVNYFDITASSVDSSTFNGAPNP